MIIQTGDNKVLWSGIRIAYKPEYLKIPENEKISGIGACFRCAVVYTESGNIYFKNKYTKYTSEDDNTGIYCISAEELFGGDGKILSMGGTNRNRFAVV